LTALVSATLDYTKCTYTLTVKNASFIQFGTLPFSLQCFGYALYADKPVHFNLKTKHVTEIEISAEYDYGQPGNDAEFGFSIDITTDSTVSKLEIKWPSGQTYLIPNNDYGSTAPFNGGWREVVSEYDNEDECYYWWYWIVFNSADDLLANMEDGLYEFTFYFNDMTTQKTTAWFGIPKTDKLIPQPTQMPAFTSFDNDDLLTSPVPFQWQPCTDPAAKSLWLCLYDSARDTEKEWIIKKTSTTRLGAPLKLKPGEYEAELDFDNWYEFKNEDGIPVEVGKYSECDYYFEVQ